MTDHIKAVEAKTNENIPQMSSGDTVSVHVKIKEGEAGGIELLDTTDWLVKGVIGQTK